MPCTAAGAGARLQRRASPALSLCSAAPRLLALAPPHRTCARHGLLLAPLLAAASSSSATPAPPSPPTPSDVAAALALLCATPDLYAGGDAVAAAVDVLVRSAPPPTDASAVLADADGEWRVVHAPHIASGSLLGTRFSPLLYTFDGPRIRSDVRACAGGAAAWLCSEGTVEPAPQPGGLASLAGFGSEAAAIRLLFSDFWVAPAGEGLRAPAGAPAPDAPAATLVRGLGRAAFLAPLAVFPVLFFSPSAGVCVFSFPPLRSRIAAVRAAAQPRLVAR